MKRNHRIARLRSIAAAALLLAMAMATLSGCRWFDPGPPKQPNTVTEFMRQPRPGSGVLGP